MFLRDSINYLDILGFEVSEGLIIQIKLNINDNQF
jgi:hypothetical protein